MAPLDRPDVSRRRIATIARSGVVAAAVALLVLAAPTSAHALDCGGPRWSGGTPRVNQHHIFCGEFRGKPDGYHTEAIFPTEIVDGVGNRRDRGNGVYTGIVHFRAGPTKFSSFYPRACTPEQILRSVQYAARQPQVPKPGGWGFVAQSAPASGASDAFCRGTDGGPITIRYGLLRNGDVNTAFPDTP